jgi:Immunity protein 52
MLEITTYFHLSDDESLAFRHHLERLYPFFKKLCETDEVAKDFLLSRATEQESYLYPIYEADGTLTKAAEAALETEHKGDPYKGLAFLNSGESDKDKWISVMYTFHARSRVPSSFNVRYNGSHRFKNEKALAPLLDLIVEALHPLAIELKSAFEVDYKTFADRPGVDWMLYLPQTLTSKQVPEAAALLPVMHAKDKKQQRGTIIVSVADAPFDAHNKMHVRAANTIEMRLVDQDLLPKYSEL